MALRKVSLDDKYVAESGQVFMTGIQALVRLPMLQQRRDERAGLTTGTFISGYRGSPLGSVDQQLWQAREFLGRHRVHFQPGVNEELAATAVWGSQQTNLFGDNEIDGVVGIWYGKGPGVDRCGDVFKHGNNAGSSKNGGVVVLLGDDHAGKSSTLPHQSEFAMVDASIPVLNPSNVQEVMDMAFTPLRCRALAGCGWASNASPKRWTARRRSISTPTAGGSRRLISRCPKAASIFAGRTCGTIRNRACTGIS